MFFNVWITQRRIIAGYRGKWGEIGEKEESRKSLEFLKGIKAVDKEDAMERIKDYIKQSIEHMGTNEYIIEGDNAVALVNNFQSELEITIWEVTLI